MPAQPRTSPPPNRDKARLQRQFARLRASLPWLDGWIRHLQSDRAALVRLPMAILLILGGIFSVLPFLGIWMLPLGLMLLALDVPILRRPVTAVIVRTRRWWSQRRRR